MTESEAKYELLEAMRDFRKAYTQLLMIIGEYECATGESVNDIKSFVNHYPFDTALEEIPILHWVGEFEDEMTRPNFKILDHTYMNTGGNCMVSVFTVWLPDKKHVAYVLANDEGCNLATVDYINNDMGTYDTDQFILESIDYDHLKGDEEYFELYRYCLNEYTKKDCRYFGCEIAIPYKLLSDELQSEVHADYLMWCEENNNCCVPTNGEKIFVHPDYPAFYDPHEDPDLQLNTIKDFKDFHDTIAGDEAFYDKTYDLTFDGKTIHLPFMADVWDAVDSLLRTTIENW